MHHSHRTDIKLLATESQFCSRFFSVALKWHQSGSPSWIRSTENTIKGELVPLHISFTIYTEWSRLPEIELLYDMYNRIQTSSWICIYKYHSYMQAICCQLSYSIQSLNLFSHTLFYRIQEYTAKLFLFCFVGWCSALGLQWDIISTILIQPPDF